MFAGFQIKEKIEFNQEYYDIGLGIYKKDEELAKQELEKYLFNDIIDGSKLKNTWFPKVNANIFISHSHADEKEAIVLAGWLKKELGLTAFIDSCVWGNIKDLQKKIDKNYCYDEKTKMYDYYSRNITTSHVHIMLVTALYEMIDNTETVLLLNTGNSVTSLENLMKDSNKTFSPWIYSELIATDLIRKQELSKYRRETIEFATESANKEVKISYNVNLEELIELDSDILESWEEDWRKNGKKYSCEQKYLEGHHPLDYLYKKVPMKLVKKVPIKSEKRQ
ncbi:MAG: hypothetical protein ACLTBU_06835 [Zhenhengia sp.]|uniref:hypothetical protein n=1 Tax=Zhenhengia sp. TaxID=2944208 RepID=UPI0039948F69